MDYLWLLSSIALGAFLVFQFKLAEPRHVKILNAFTGAYLLSLTMLHLFPELYHVGAGAGGGEEGHAHGHGPEMLLGTLILAGFFTQIALDVISMGVEHGHSHHLHGKMPVGVIAGLCLHALVEAMALGDEHTHYDPASRKMLLMSIVLHNLPVSIALLGMLLQTGMRRKTALMFLGLFALMAPIGMFLSTHTNLADYSRELTAFVIGIFMHISTTILFESSETHRFNFAKLAAIIFGTALGFITVMVH